MDLNKVLKQNIAILAQERDRLQTKANDLNKAIKAFQTICGHDWKPDGNDSHKDYEKCDICGATRSI